MGHVGQGRSAYLVSLCWWNSVVVATLVMENMVGLYRSLLRKLCLRQAWSHITRESHTNLCCKTSKYVYMYVLSQLVFHCSFLCQGLSPYTLAPSMPTNMLGSADDQKELEQTEPKRIKNEACTCKLEQNMNCLYMMLLSTWGRSVCGLGVTSFGLLTLQPSLSPTLQYVDTKFGSPLHHPEHHLGPHLLCLRKWSPHHLRV